MTKSKGGPNLQALAATQLIRFRNSDFLQPSSFEFGHPKWCIRQDWLPKPCKSGAQKEMVAPRPAVSPATATSEAEDDHNFTTDAEMVGCHGFAPCSRRVRAGTSLSKFATLVAICKDRDTKAKLNRRGQVCGALAGTGISRRVNRTANHR
jgi:hypothetical protein